jgi:hypothetical protein
MRLQNDISPIGTIDGSREFGEERSLELVAHSIVIVLQKR